MSQEEWDMPVPGVEEEDLTHLSLATSEMEEGLWRGGSVFRGRGIHRRVISRYTFTADRFLEKSVPNNLQDNELSVISGRTFS